MSVQTQQAMSATETKKPRAKKEQKTQVAEKKETKATATTNTTAPKTKKPKVPKAKVAAPKTKKPKVPKKAVETTTTEKPKSTRIELVSEAELGNLNTKGVKELKDYARAMGLREYSNLKKEDLKNIVERISTLAFTNDDVKYMSSKLLRSIARGSGLTGYSKAVKKENIVTMIKDHREKGGLIGFSGTTKAKRGKIISEPFDPRSGPNTYSRGQLQQYASLLDLKGYSDKTSKVSDLHALVRKAIDDTSQIQLANLKIRALKRTIKMYRKEEPKLRLKGSPEELYAHLKELRQKFGPKSRINHTVRVQYEKGKTFTNKELKSISRQIGICGFTKMKTKDLEEFLERIHENKLRVEDYNLLSLKSLKYMSKYHKIKISKMNEDRRVPMTRIELFEKLTGLKVQDSQVKKKGNPEALMKYKEKKNAAAKKASPKKAEVTSRVSPKKTVTEKTEPKTEPKTKTSGGKKNTKK